MRIEHNFMRQTWKAVIFSCCLAAGVAHAQTWEVGAIGGYGFAKDLTLKSPTAEVKAGFKDGLAIGAFLADEMYEHFSGEIRYLYRDSDLKLSSGATEATFGARTHILHMDWLAHFQARESPVRFFVAFGGGVKVVQGIGEESATQPLGRFGALTHTRQVLPVGDAGAGVKVNLGKRVRFRLEGRDYISTRPDELIAPAPGVKYQGVQHDFMALASLGVIW
jgi:hypothetical protein